MKKIILIFSVLFLVVSCANKVPATTEDKVKIAVNNTQWVLDDDGVSDVEITLNIARSRVEGNAGCNTYSAELKTTEGGDFVVKNTISTRKTCEKIAVENYYLSLLQKVDKYNVTPTALELYQGNVLLLKFKRK